MRYTPSVFPSVCPVPSVNLKTENHTMFKLKGEITYVRYNRQNNLGVKKSKSSRKRDSCISHRPFWQHLLVVKMMTIIDKNLLALVSEA